MLGIVKLIILQKTKNQRRAIAAIYGILASTKVQHALVTVLFANIGVAAVFYNNPLKV